MTPPVSPETPQQRAKRVLEYDWRRNREPFAASASKILTTECPGLARDVLSLSAEVEVLRGIVKRYARGWVKCGCAEPFPHWHHIRLRMTPTEPLSPEESRVLSELTEEGA